MCTLLHLKISKSTDQEKKNYTVSLQSIRWMNYGPWILKHLISKLLIREKKKNPKFTSSKGLCKNQICIDVQLDCSLNKI